ncbi:unnamed protein product [Hermetia illucens]|uniref:Endonuclease/exonuclease/phosphatase domain-containing protein n=1 Tax=Hermetia illucens TaxID=343691 RepID=A0A7R8V2N6_HERIL|nr:unnamed protein product [Hermetia illucens]
MKARCFKQEDFPPGAEHVVHLFHSNKHACAHNELVLGKMKTEDATVIALDEVFGEPTTSAKDKAPQNVALLPTSQTYGLPHKLLLKVDARYMLTGNIDTSDGLVNGADGVLKALDYGTNKRTGECRPLRIWLQFPDVKIGKTKRANISHSSRIFEAKLRKNWTPIEYLSSTIKRWKASNLQVRRTQFPVVPAEAITIHKSQGSTIAKVAVHLPSNCHRALMYVACSRATSSEGLSIINDKEFKLPEPLSHLSPLSVEMKRLTEQPFEPMFKFLREERSPTIRQILFHNVQSLRKHLSDISADPGINKSDIVMLVETWSCATDHYKLDGFIEIDRVDGPHATASNRGFGTIVWVKDNILNTGRLMQESIKHFIHNSDNQGHCEGVMFVIDNIQLVAIYRSPHYSLNSFFATLYKELFSAGKSQANPIIVCGDFNENFISGKETAIEAYFASNGLRPIIQNIPTTRGHTQIDNIFSNISVDADVYEIFFSCHRSLWARF